MFYTSTMLFILAYDVFRGWRKGVLRTYELMDYASN